MLRQGPYGFSGFPKFKKLAKFWHSPSLRSLHHPLRYWVLSLEPRPSLPPAQCFRHEQLKVSHLACVLVALVSLWHTCADTLKHWQDVKSLLEISSWFHVGVYHQEVSEINIISLWITCVHWARYREYYVSVFWYQVYQVRLREGLLTSQGLPRDSTRVLEAEPGKLDIKRHSPSILFNSSN